MTASKPNTAPKSKPMPGGNSVHSVLPTREPNWANPRRVRCVEAMRKLGATSVTKAALAEDIARAMGTVAEVKMTERVDLVKIHLDVYRTTELIHNGFAASCKHEGERVLRYYLTSKGVKTKFPVPAKPAKDPVPPAKPAKDE